MKSSLNIDFSHARGASLPRLALSIRVRFLYEVVSSLTTVLTGIFRGITDSRSHGEFEFGIQREDGSCATPEVFICFLTSRQHPSP